MNEEYTQVSAREMERAPESLNASRNEAEEADSDDLPPHTRDFSRELGGHFTCRQ